MQDTIALLRTTHTLLEHARRYNVKSSIKVLEEIIENKRRRGTLAEMERVAVLESIVDVLKTLR